MKTLKKIFLFMAVIGLLVSCSKSDDFLEKDYSLATGLDQERYITMQSIDLKVRYRIIGEGPVDMVFIPGWTNPLTAYTKQFDYFRDKARCIYIELPGHGLSDAPEGIEYTMRLMADAIYDVIKKEEVKNFIAIGFSWAAILLTQFEIKYPGMITQLTILDGAPTAWPPMTEEIRNAKYAAQLAMTQEQKLAALEWLIPPLTAPEDLNEWGQYFLDFPNWLLANMWYHCIAEEVCQPYPWTIPIMMISRKMKPAKEEKITLYFPNCDINIIGGDQHCIQWAYYGLVNQMIDEFSFSY